MPQVTAKITLTVEEMLKRVGDKEVKVFWPLRFAGYKQLALGTFEATDFIYEDQILYCKEADAYYLTETKEGILTRADKILSYVPALDLQIPIPLETALLAYKHKAYSLAMEVKKKYSHGMHTDKYDVVLTSRLS